MSPLSLRLKSNLSKKPTSRSACYVLHIGFLVYSSILTMEATCSPKCRFVFQRDTQSYIPEDRTLQSYIWRTGCSIENSIDTLVSIIRLNQPHLNTAVAWDISILSDKCRYKWTISSDRRQISSSITVARTARGAGLTEQVMEPSRYSLEEQKNRLLTVHHALSVTVTHTLVKPS
jgi:hypothetical protein